jgi:hydroxymethylglutaryl-CoA lyase
LRSGSRPPSPSRGRPRDGLQNEPNPVDAAVKVELIERLAAAGLPGVEATSFGRPEWVPQRNDAEQVAAALSHGRGTRFPVTSRSRCSPRSSRPPRATGLRACGYVSMAWGDPWEGPVSLGQGRLRRAARVGARARRATIGVATPPQVQWVLRAVGQDVPREALAVHFHDTYGQALANVLAALEAGVTTVDAFVAGLDGCPYAKSATGNLATEDLVYMRDGLGAETGVDLAAVVETAHWIAGVLGRAPGAVARALGAAA